MADVMFKMQKQKVEKSDKTDFKASDKPWFSKGETRNSMTSEEIHMKFMSHLVVELQKHEST